MKRTKRPNLRVVDKKLREKRKEIEDKKNRRKIKKKQEATKEKREWEKYKERVRIKSEDERWWGLYKPQGSSTSLWGPAELFFFRFLVIKKHPHYVTSLAPVLLLSTFTARTLFK